MEVINQSENRPYHFNYQSINGIGKSLILNFHTMKPTFFIFFVLIGLTVKAQFQEHIIESAPNYVNSIVSADLDNDNDNDILVSGGENNQLKWFDNSDGLGNFNITHVIMDQPNQILANYIALTDINGDNNLDFLVSTSELDQSQIRTFKNTDGLGNFEQFSISMTTFGSQSTIAVGDIDGDNDNDWVSSVSASEFNTHKISWFENEDTGTVTEQIIDDTFLKVVQLTDLDNDNDYDIVGFIAAGYSQGQILWYENTDGLGSFVKHIITNHPNLNYNANLIAKDLDNDGDLDIIIAYNDIISWYKNDGQGNFGPEIIINNDNNTKRNILVIDLNSDGHLDITSTGNDNSVYYYENDGQRNFSSEIIIENLYRANSPLFAIDINGDNKIDIITSSSENGKIAWYENTWELSVNQNTLSEFTIYPNPANDFIHIKSKTGISQIKVYNELGVSVLTKQNHSSMDISELQNGIYIIKVTSVYGDFGFKKLIKR